jgi:hypothetical protein
LVGGLLASKDAAVYLPYFANCGAPLAVTVLTLLGVSIFFIVVLTRPSKLAPVDVYTELNDGQASA